MTFLSLQNDVNVPAKSNKEKLLVAVLKVTDQKQQDPEPGQRHGSVPKCHGSATLMIRQCG
jgi:hypothetical protein